MKRIGVAIAALAAYMALVGMLGRLLHLHGERLYVLVGGLIVIGLLAMGAIFWFWRRKQAEEDEGEGASSGADSSNDARLLFQDANRRLKNSSLGKGTTLSSQTLFFLMGDPGVAKTSSIANSGLEPELLAGHAHQDSNILPTAFANIWYSRQAVFVDPSGHLFEQRDQWKQLVELVSKGGKLSGVRKNERAPRAAIVCFDVETFLKPGGIEGSASSARKLGRQLQDISRLLGIQLPVYVLFTKTDRVVGFADYVSGFTQEEISEVLGVTLPVKAATSGIYAEEETARLSGHFDELIFSLAERRLDLLGRENELAKRSIIYEFPRELGKLRTPLVQFLVDLGRPSQLTVHPFLRGFYFSGVRPIVVEEVISAAYQSPKEQPRYEVGATRMFSPGDLGLGSNPGTARRAASRKIPQWIFLGQLFHEVLIKDDTALGMSSVSVRVSLLQRLVFGAIALAGLICSIGFLTSFVGNHELVGAIDSASTGLSSVQLASDKLPQIGDLQKLDKLRQQLQTIEGYEQDGVPLSLRWGLYEGDRVYPDAKAAYFRSFRALIFSDTQGRLLNALRALQDKPGPGATYDTTYNELKAYLITTSNNDKSTREFLTPVLMDHWIAGRTIDGDRTALAQAQVDYYASALLKANPYSSTNDGLSIQRARNYLANFAGIDRFYLPLLAKASIGNPGISFNEKFPDSIGVITSKYRVRGQFTLNGFAFMQSAIRNPSNMSVEEWVLGKATASELDQATLQSKLNERYDKDFASEWHNVLETSSVNGYKDYNDAAQKLQKLSGLTSPLLELLWFVSHNTATTVPDVTSPFLPVQAIEPPGPPDRLPEAYVLPSNKDYILALTKLQTDIAAVASSPADPALATQASGSASAGMISVASVMGTRVDQQFNNEKSVRLLLEEPITGAQALMKNGPTDQVNGAAKGMCSQFGQAMGKFPFDPNSTQDVSMDQLNALLAPKTGSLWTLYDSKLAALLTKNGSTYVANPQGPVKLTPAFVAFFNRAAALSDALYSSGSATPKFNYTIKVMESNIGEVTLKSGSDSLTGLGHSKSFVWTGTPENILVVPKDGAPLYSASGPWAIFHFVSEAHVKSPGSVMNLEWTIQNNNRAIKLPDGEVESYHYQLQVDGTNPFLSGAFSHLNCTAQAAH